MIRCDSVGVDDEPAAVSSVVETTGLVTLVYRVADVA
jgi:hypothetical protein